MSQKNGLEKILTVIKSLMEPDGCPWDREQSPETLCDYLIEESFELTSAIRSGNMEEIQEEMGDVFFLLFFMAYFFQKDFSLDDVWNKNARKMISRHPHVFKNENFTTREDLMRNWEKIKKEEKSGENKSPFASIPKNLPPLLMAYRINSKASRSGFTWKTDEDVRKKLDEEWNEFTQALNQGDDQKAQEEFGDYLFTLVEYGRRKKIKANSALSISNAKFLNRITKMESLAAQKGLDISTMGLKDMDALWDEVKALE